MLVRFRDTYSPTSRNYFHTEPKRRAFQKLNDKFLGPAPPLLVFKNIDIFTQIEQNDPIRHPL